MKIDKYHISLLMLFLGLNFHRSGPGGSLRPFQVRKKIRPFSFNCKITVIGGIRCFEQEGIIAQAYFKLLFVCRGVCVCGCTVTVVLQNMYMFVCMHMYSCMCSPQA